MSVQLVRLKSRRKSATSIQRIDRWNGKRAKRSLRCPFVFMQYVLARTCTTTHILGGHLFDELCANFYRSRRMKPSNLLGQIKMKKRAKKKSQIARFFFLCATLCGACCNGNIWSCFQSPAYERRHSFYQPRWMRTENVELARNTDHFYALLYVSPPSSFTWTLFIFTWISMDDNPTHDFLLCF